MPFVKKHDAKGQPPLQPAADVRKIFVGRHNELHFFTESILKPEDPACNIISIHGDGGVGKSTLLARFLDEIHTPPYKDYCLAASVDERQATPSSIMEKCTEQLHLQGAFRKALAHYKEAVRRQQEEQSTLQEEMLQRAPDFAGAIVEGVPLVGPILREGLKATTAHAVNHFRTDQSHSTITMPDDPINDLTRAFVTELNSLAEAPISLSSGWATPSIKRNIRIILLFDTFEQLAPEIAPWLLDSFLSLDINSNIVLIIAGRTPLERSLPDDPKRWLQFKEDGNTIYSISLQSFTEQETRLYLEQRGITNPERIQRIWQLSRGLPLYLGLLTSDPWHEVDPTADVVANFLRWIPQNEEIKRRLVLDASLFSRPFNQDDLDAFSYIPEHDRPALYRWLIRQPFVRRLQQEGRYRYHELAEDLFSRHLYQNSPNACYATHRALADYYRSELAKLRSHSSDTPYHHPDWFPLVLALAQQLFLLPEASNHVAAIEQLLLAYEYIEQDEEITRLLRDLSLDQLYNQANADARQSATILLNYIESFAGEPLGSNRGKISLHLQSKSAQVEFASTKIAAADALLARISPSSSSFSPTLLASIYEERGIAYRLIRKHSLALADFEQATTLDPNYASAYGNRGTTYRYLDQDEEAVRWCTHALTLDDSLDWVYVSRAEALRHLKKYRSAIEDFSRAIALDPHYGRAFTGRGRCFLELADYEAARKDFEYALTLDPTLPIIYRQLGELYRKQEEHHLAIDSYTHAIELDPLYHLHYALRSLAHSQLSHYEAALTDLDQAIALNLSEHWLYRERGRTYRHLNQYEAALTDLETAIHLKPRDPSSYGQRALVYADLHHYDQALADLDYALTLDPFNALTYRYRAGIHLALQNPDQARADYTRARDLAPSDLNAPWLLTWLDLFQLPATNQPEIITELARIAALNPRHYLAFVCQAVSLWLQNDTQQALHALTDATHIKPKHWDAPFWQALILASSAQPTCAPPLQQALQLHIPPILLTPLHVLKETQHNIYSQYIQPLLAST